MHMMKLNFPFSRQTRVCELLHDNFIYKYLRHNVFVYEYNFYLKKNGMIKINKFEQLDRNELISRSSEENYQKQFLKQ